MATNATRKVADCRLFPSESNCSLTIAGTEDEVLVAATQHAVSWHKHEVTPHRDGDADLHPWRRTRGARAQSGRRVARTTSCRLEKGFEGKTYGKIRCKSPNSCHR
jgi:Protein of unknown function (DUF1059)